MSEAIMGVCVGMMIGAGAAILALLYFAGPAARTLATANIMSKRIAFIPRDDKTLDIEIPNKIDDKGRWHMKEVDNKIEIYTPDPNDIYIVSRKLRGAHLLDNFSITVNPVAAKLAEYAGVGEGDRDKEGKPIGKTRTIIKHGRESISWPKLKDRVRELAGPSHMAGILATAIKFNTPLPSEGRGISHQTKIALAGIGMAAVAIFVGIYIAYAQGWIG